MRQAATLDPVDLCGAQLATFVRAADAKLFWRTHYHEVDELIYASRGVLVAQTGQQCWVLPPLRALWLSAGTPHEVGCSDGVMVTCLYIAPQYVRLASPALLEVSPLLRQLILRASGWGTLGSADAAQAHVMAVMRDEIEGAHSAPALDMVLPQDARARRVAVALANADDIDASLDDICRTAGASRRTVERQFRQDTGLSLGQWRTRARMQRSLDMLARGEKMNFTAAEVGYSTPSAYIASFKRLLGTTPGQYLRTKS